MTSTDPIANLATLIRCPSVTPAEGGALSALEAMLKPLGFAVDRVMAKEAGTPDIENLYARLGTEGPHLMFAGHTDVVPVGHEAAWSHGPFSADIAGGVDLSTVGSAVIAAVVYVVASVGLGHWSEQLPVGQALVDVA